VLIWGADPEDRSPLFPERRTLRAEPTRPRGPAAGAFRRRVLEDLNRRLSTHRPPILATFSEDWETFGHCPDNPGLYEPLQLEAAALVVMLLPGPRSLAVNTWELALALEGTKEGELMHLDKLVLLLPESVYHFLRAVFQCKVSDPKDFRMQELMGKPEPSLGAANSFAARWLVLAMRQRYAGTDPWAPIPEAMPIRCYPDSVSWDLHGRGTRKLTPLAREIIDNLVDLVETRLPQT